MLPHLVTLDHHVAPRSQEQLRRKNIARADWMLFLYPPQNLELLRPHLHARGTVHEHIETHAYIDRGRWMAMCPFCPSAQVVHPDDPRFLCAGSDGCVNHEIAGAYARIVFPTPRMRRQIETLLIKRPNLNTRNWLPVQVALHFHSYSETVADLRLENAAHGIR